MLGVLADQAGNVKAVHRSPTPYDAERLIDDLVEMVQTLWPGHPSELAGVGVGAAGLVDNQGTLHYGPNVGRVREVDIRRGLLMRMPDMHVVIDNDATCATWSECRAGAGRGVAEMALVTLGTGIGAGIVAGGRIWRGRNGYAAEFGHMTVVNDGVECVCGKRGCWEAYASGRALGRFGREAAADGRAPGLLEIAGSVDQIRGEHVTKLARSGDAGAMAVIDHFAYWVGVGVANVIAMCDPEAVIIGGGMAEDADLFIDIAAEHANRLALGNGNRPQVPLLRAELGERAGALGAVLMVFDEMVEVPAH